MSDLCFSKYKYPEMLSIPLKGELLKEFLLLCKEDVDASKAILVSDHPELNAYMTNLQAIYARVLQGLIKGLDSDDAQSFGIAAEDMEKIIRKNTGLDGASLDSVGTMIGAIDKVVDYASSGSKDEIAKNAAINHLQNAIVENIVHTLMQRFSMCLAIQEGKQKEYLGIVHDYFQAVPAQVKQQLPDPSILDEQSRAAATDSTVDTLINAFALHEKRRQRKSPVAGLEGEILYGNKSKRTGGLYQYICDALAYINGLDVGKSVDRQVLRGVVQGAFAKATQKAGLPPLSVSELGY